MHQRALIYIKFCTQLKTFSLHSFMARWQRSQFNNLRDNLPNDLALVVIDFAENYVCHYQNQVQAAYYDLPKVDIHPVVVYTKCPFNHIFTIACSSQKKKIRFF